MEFSEIPEVDLNEPIDIGMMSYVESLIRSSTFDHDYQERLEQGLNDLNFGDAVKLIVLLKRNQLDPCTQCSHVSQTMIKTKLCEI